MDLLHALFLEMCNLSVISSYKRYKRIFKEQCFALLLSVNDLSIFFNLIINKANCIIVFEERREFDVSRVCVPFSQLSLATLLHVEFDGLQFSYRCLTRIYCTPFRSVSRFIQKYSGNRNFYGCRSFLQLNFDTACLQAKKKKSLHARFSLSLPVFGINETTFHLKSFYHLLINA